MQPVSIITAIRNTIEMLTSQDANNKLAADIVEEYKNIFELIPRVDLLPTDVLAHLPLKDKHKSIKYGKYRVLHPLCPNFKELIDLWLKQGFIQLSNSRYSSPSFVISRCNPTTLP
jgi:hypothetical protein